MCVCVPSCGVGSGGSYITKVLLLKLTLKNKKVLKERFLRLSSPLKNSYKAANTQESDDPQWMARRADI